MSSYLSNLLTTTTSRYNSLRRNLLDSEGDGDTEDDTHIARVLRAYYMEKGRPFPPWLPPDPKAPATPSTQQFVRSTAPQTQQSAPSRGGLSDLWDPPAQQAPPTQPTSLRNRPAPRMVNSQGRVLPPQDVMSSQGRPLPSQRAGSYQSTQSTLSSRPSVDTPPPGSSGGGGGATAQERLKQRLWGSGRSGSPTGSVSPGGTGLSTPTRNPFERSHSANPPSTGGRFR